MTHQTTIDSFRAAFLAHYGRECHVVRRGRTYWVVDGVKRVQRKIWELDQWAIELRGRSVHERLPEPATVDDSGLPF